MKLVRALFGTPGTAVLTTAIAALLAFTVPSLLRWAVAAATWTAENRRGCAPGGACWAFIRARLGCSCMAATPRRSSGG